MQTRIRYACRTTPSIARTAYGAYGIAKESLNGSNIQDAVRPSPLGDAISRVLEDQGGSLRVKEILAKILAKKLFVFRRKDGSVSNDPKKMRASVNTVCNKNPRFVRIALGTYAIAKECLNGATIDELNEEDSNAAANNNNNNNIMSSPYALVLREALESGLMTEEEYAEAVQEAQRVGSKSPEEKKEIEDYNEAF
ncbi:hypothetical protein A3770_13p68230 [Chloropicon primus]|uniref:HTH HARE-type domain-containing protein n=1 Tax=Chloropicon primus TaxID=1764295 RepID=A0A5B8MX91_9CHLO|nr:hypothetical protein A3770_13p68230 [Chloropicon primus]|eukprot:QDZ24305.1 hypothetical protein A3770_13p68230 [Chloropicon primus]